MGRRTKVALLVPNTCAKSGDIFFLNPIITKFMYTSSKVFGGGGVQKINEKGSVQLRNF